MEGTGSDKNRVVDEISRLRAELACERRERELSLIAQEHRLLPAIGNLTKAWSHPDPAMRAELWPRAAQALFWCLLPRPVTAGLTVATVLTLVFAFWQAGLALDQTDQMRVQNSLAQAQRQASIASAAADIFSLIEHEKKESSESRLNVCGGKVAEKCWVGERFVLSDSLSGRIVSLTHALGPYKSVDEESDFSGDKTCTEGVFSMVSDKALGLMVSTKWLNGESLNIERLRLEFSRRYSRVYAEESKSFFHEGKERFDEFVGYFRNEHGVKLSCKALSPERGQLLIALLAANVSVEHLEGRGASFEYSEIKGKIKAKSLEGVSLAHSSLVGVDLSDTSVSRVDFSRADLRGVYFGKEMSDLNLSNARIQVDLRGVHAIERFIKYNKSKVFGLTDITMNGVKGEAMADWCAVSKGAFSFSQPVDLNGFAILIERRLGGDGYNESGRLMFKRMDDEGLIFSGVDRLGGFELLYHNLERCGEVKVDSSN